MNVHRTIAALALFALLVSRSQALAQTSSNFPFERESLQALTASNIGELKVLGQIGDTPNIYNYVPVSPDGKQFAVVMHRSIDIYSVDPLTRTFSIIPKIELIGSRTRWHPTQNQIAIMQGTEDNWQLGVYSTSNGELALKIDLPKDGHNFEFTSDGKKIVVRGEKRLLLFDSQSGLKLDEVVLNDSIDELFRIKGKDSSIAGLTYSKGTFQEIDLATGKLLASINLPSVGLYAAQPSPSGQKVVAPSGAYTHTILFADGSVPKEFAGHDRFTNTFAWHPDEKRILSGGVDGVIKLWNSDTQTYTLSLAPLGRQTISAVAWLSDDRFVSAGETGAVTVVDAKTGNVIDKTTGGLPSYSSSVALSKDGKWLATGSSAGQVSIFDVNNGKVVWQLDDLYAGINQIAFSLDGRYIGAITNEVWADSDPPVPLISAKPRFAVAIWETKTGKLVLNKEGVRRAIGFTRDSKNVIVCGINDQSGPYVMLNLASKKARPMNEKCYANFAVHPTLNRIADFRSLIEYSGSNVGVVYRTRLDEVEPYTIDGPNIFSADGALAAHHGTKFIRVCDGQIKNKFAPDSSRAKPCLFKATFTSSEWLRNLSFSPNNQLLLFDDGRGRLNVGDITSSRTVFEFKSTTKRYDAVAWFLPDGKRVLVFGNGLEIWGVRK
jgi:WD40 repeat protein